MNKKTRAKLHAAQHDVVTTGLFARISEGRYKKLVSNLHGSAEWATKEDIKGMGLLIDPNKSDCVVLGGIVDEKEQHSTGEANVRYLFHDGPEHILVYAPTRSGKGVGIIIPTLLTWRGSTVVLDVKGENYEQTAGFRRLRLGQKALKFEPANPSVCSRFNILAEVEWGTLKEQKSVDNIAVIIAISQQATKDPHWDNSAKALLICLMIHAWYKGVMDEATRMEELREEEAKPGGGDPIELSFLRKPKQGSMSIVANLATLADTAVVAALGTKHVLAYADAVRGDSLPAIEDCPNCVVGGLKIVTGIDQSDVSKGVKEAVGEAAGDLLGYRFATDDDRRKLDYWCDDCMKIGQSDPTSIPPVYQVQPDWLVRHNGKVCVRAVHPKVYTLALGYLTKPDDERASVKSTLTSKLTLFEDPIVAQSTSYSDWRIKDLMYHDTGVSLYLVFAPGDIDRLSPLIRLLVTAIADTYTDEMEFFEGRTLDTWENRLLMLNDEFPSIGGIEKFEKFFAYMAGYGIKSMTIVQDLVQIKKAYGEHEGIRSNHHIQIAYAPNNVETADYIARLCGKTTVAYEKESRSTQAGQMFGGTSKSLSVEQSQRDLIDTAEVMSLRGISVKRDRNGKAVTGADGSVVVDGGETVIKIAGQPPIKGTRALWFNDPVWTEAAKLSNEWATKMRHKGGDDPEWWSSCAISDAERRRAKIKNELRLKEFRQLKGPTDYPVDSEIDAGFERALDRVVPSNLRELLQDQGE